MSSQTLTLSIIVLKVCTMEQFVARLACSKRLLCLMAWFILHVVGLCSIRMVFHPWSKNMSVGLTDKFKLPLGLSVCVHGMSVCRHLMNWLTVLFTPVWMDGQTDRWMLNLCL